MRKEKGIINIMKIIIPNAPETKAETSAAIRIIRHNIGYPILSFLIFIIFLAGAKGNRTLHEIIHS